MPALAYTALRRFWIDARHRLTPPRLLVISFLALIVAGTVGLRTLPGLYSGPGLSWLDALFTATSAVCVTGLIVVDTASYFTPLGQVYLLLLIQLGGLGILTFTTLIITALGRRLSLHHEAVSATAAEVAPEVDVRRLTLNVVRFTLLFEAAGALVLWLAWGRAMGWSEGAWHALFQAVSAFCNAGFSTFSDSLTGFQSSPVVLGAIMTLIVVGGLGFLTMEELHLWNQRRRRGGGYRISLHSRLVLATTAVLLVSGWLLFTLFEWNTTLRTLPTAAKAVNGLFMSVTARTAGFNTVDYAQTSEATNFLTILLMSIGGSPGSTAGGIKTTTFAVLGLLALSRMRGFRVATLWHRSVPEETVQRAVGLFVVAFGLVTLFIFGLIISEIGFVGHAGAAGQFVSYFFEAVSAFNTVGLSMGVTPVLSPAGKALIIVLMYLGRIGPLTFAAALALRRRPAVAGIRYAYEEVVIG